MAVDVSGMFGIAEFKGYQFAVMGAQSFASAVNQPIAAICGSAHMLVIAMRDSVVHIYDAGAECLVIMTYLCEVSCCDVSTLFDLIAIGNKRGVVMLCSLAKRKVLLAFEVRDWKPVWVRITRGWGIVLVLAADRFSRRFWIGAHDMEGELINEREVPERVVAVAAFMSGSGFDYLVFADAKGAVFVLDVIRMEVEGPLYQSRDRVVGVRYDCKKKHVVVVSEGGTVTYVQKEFE
jgi:hypothetical protein